jgi:hypothetical protein
MSSGKELTKIVTSLKVMSKVPGSRIDRDFTHPSYGKTKPNKHVSASMVKQIKASD